MASKTTAVPWKVSRLSEPQSTPVGGQNRDLGAESHTTVCPYTAEFHGFAHGPPSRWSFVSANKDWVAEFPLFNHGFPFIDLTFCTASMNRYHKKCEERASEEDSIRKA